MNKAIPLCWLNGEIIPAEQASIPVMDHALLYGDGVFEGIRFYNGKAFRLQAHLNRLQDSAAVLRLQIPLTEEYMKKAIQDLIQSFEAPDGYIRLVVTRGDGPMGLDPAPCLQPRLFIIAAQLAYVDVESRTQGIRAVIASTRRLQADGLDPRVKSLNYLNHILARTEANYAGAQEAILLNSLGNVAEGTADNVFAVKDDKLFTPPVTDGALDGVTRGLVIELAEQLGLDVQEKTLAPYDLYTADECFLTGTGAELIPVREIDGRPMKCCPGDIYKKLAQSFHKAIQRETQAA